ncbi:MAG: DUF2179 domain-containing protein [Phycisphaerae bacterium]|jgi:uncharacterized protein YebE (UPF0316 family)
MNPVDWLAAYPSLLPFFIFGLRVCDVSMDTMRMISVVRGRRLLAAVLGFVQVLVWLVSISAVMRYLDKPINMVAYAAGFATGTWVGIWLEGHLALGQQIVRLISNDLDAGLADRLRATGFAVTELEGHGRDAPVKICFIAVRRREVPDLLRQATELDPDVFITVEDVRAANRALARHVPDRFSLPGAIKAGG